MNNKLSNNYISKNRLLLLLSLIVALVFMSQSLLSAESFIFSEESETQLSSIASPLSTDTSVTLSSYSYEVDDFFFPAVTSGRTDFWALRPILEIVETEEVTCDAIRFDFDLSHPTVLYGFNINLTDISYFSYPLWNLTWYFTQTPENYSQDYYTKGQVLSVPTYHSLSKGGLFLLWNSSQTSDLPSEWGAGQYSLIILSNSLDNQFTFGSTSSSSNSSFQLTRETTTYTPLSSDLAIEPLTGLWIGSHELISGDAGVSELDWYIPNHLASANYYILAYFSDTLSGYFDSYDFTVCEIINEISNIELFSSGFTSQYGDVAFFEVSALMNETPVLNLEVSLSYVPLAGGETIFLPSKLTDSQGTASWTIPSNLAIDDYLFTAEAQLLTDEFISSSSIIEIIKETIFWQETSVSGFYGSHVGGTLVEGLLHLIDDDGSPVPFMDFYLIETSIGQIIELFSTEADGTHLFSTALPNPVGIFSDTFRLIPQDTTLVNYSIGQHSLEMVIQKGEIISHAIDISTPYLNVTTQTILLTNQVNQSIEGLEVSYFYLDLISSDWVFINNSTTDSSGEFSITYPLLDSGIYIIKIEVAESVNYTSSTFNIVLTVTPLEGNISSEDIINDVIIVEYGHSLDVTIKVTSQGVPVSNVYVSFYVSTSLVDLHYEFIDIGLTNELGEVTFIWQPDRGEFGWNWPIMFQLNSNNYQGSEECFFTIEKATTSIEALQPVLVYGSSSLWTVRLVDSGIPLEGYELNWMIYVDSSLFLLGTITTNSSGYADILLICPSQGINITIAVSFDGTSTLKANSSFFTPFFEKGEPVLTAFPTETNEQNEALLTITLKNLLNEPLEGYEVRFYISFDGENWVLVNIQYTDSLGNADYLCDIPYSQGSYFWSARLSETVKYLLAESVTSLIVDNFNSELTGSDQTCDYTDLVIFSWQLTYVNSSPLNDQLIYIYVEGIFQSTLVTNSSGYVTYQSPEFLPGVYNITAIYSGSGNIFGSESLSWLTVVNESVILSEPSINLFYGENVSQSYYLYDDDGSLVSGAELRLSINGSSYDLTTDSFGKIVFFLPELSAGNYILSISITSLPEGYSIPDMINGLVVISPSSILIIEPSVVSSWVSGEDIDLEIVLQSPYSGISGSLMAQLVFLNELNETVFSQEIVVIDGYWIGSLTVDFLLPGEYTLELVIFSSVNYLVVSDSWSVTVDLRTAQITSAFSIVNGNELFLEVNLTDSQSSELLNGEISIYLYNDSLSDWMFLGTFSNYPASYFLGYGLSGQFTFQAIFNGSSLYSATDKTWLIEISDDLLVHSTTLNLNIDDVIYGDDILIEVTVILDNGSYLVNGEIEFYFLENETLVFIGSNYTDNNGYTSIYYFSLLDAMKYEIFARLIGTEKYTDSTCEEEFTVLPKIINMVYENSPIIYQGTVTCTITLIDENGEIAPSIFVLLVVSLNYGETRIFTHFDAIHEPITYFNWFNDLPAGTYSLNISLSEISLNYRVQGNMDIILIIQKEDPSIRNITSEATNGELTTIQGQVVGEYDQTLAGIELSFFNSITGETVYVTTNATGWFSYQTIFIAPEGDYSSEFSIQETPSLRYNIELGIIVLLKGETNINYFFEAQADDPGLLNISIITSGGEIINQFTITVLISDQEGLKTNTTYYSEGEILTLELLPLNAGVYSLEIIFKGNNLWEEVISVEDISVEKNSLNLLSNDFEVDWNDDLILEASISTQNGMIPDDCYWNVTFVLEDYSESTLVQSNNGTISLIWKFTASGNWTVVWKCIDYSDYLEINYYSNVEVVKELLSIEFSSSQEMNSLVYHEEIVAEIAIMDDESLFSQETWVIVQIKDGSEIIYEESFWITSEGEIRLVINFSPGSYQLSLSLPDHSNYLMTSYEIQITVIPAELIVEPSVENINGTQINEGFEAIQCQQYEEITVFATLTDHQGAVSQEVIIYVYNDGGLVLSSENGLLIKLDLDQNYLIVITYEGSDEYLSFSYTIEIKIIPNTGPEVLEWQLEEEILTLNLADNHGISEIQITINGYEPFTGQIVNQTFNLNELVYSWSNSSSGYILTLELLLPLPGEYQLIITIADPYGAETVFGPVNFQKSYDEPSATIMINGEEPVEFYYINSSHIISVLVIDPAITKSVQLEIFNETESYSFELVLVNSSLNLWELAFVIDFQTDYNWTVTITSLSGEITVLEPTSKVTFTTKPREILDWESSIVISDQNVTIEITIILDEGVPLNINTSYIEVLNLDNSSIAKFPLIRVNDTVYISTIVLNSTGEYWIVFSLETIDGLVSRTKEYMMLNDQTNRTLGSFLGSIYTDLPVDTISFVISFAILYVPSKMFVIPKIKTKIETLINPKKKGSGHLDGV
ncbi:MAG: hypothetical protein ACTSYA_02135 [Candidatus Kariarchaeaceae archaeon]